MGKVIAQMQGSSDMKAFEASTVGEVKAKMGADGYTAAVNGSPASDGDALNDGDIVTFAKAVKGGC